MRISRVQKEIEQWRTDPPLTSGAQVEPPVFPGMSRYRHNKFMSIKKKWNMKRIIFFYLQGLYSALPKPVCPPSNVDDAFVALWKYMAQKVIANISHYTHFSYRFHIQLFAIM